jgi:hypothetical protein
MPDSKNSKISELVELTDPSNSDYIPIVDTVNQETKKISYTSLVTALNEDDDSYSKTESDALIAAETTRATTAEALLAPRETPVFTGETVTLDGTGANAGIEINAGVSGTGTAYIDFHSDSDAPLDYDARIASESGNLVIQNSSNGKDTFFQNASATGVFKTSLVADSEGKVRTPFTGISDIIDSRQLTTKEYVESVTAANASDISTNTAAIATNTAAIATNTAAIATNTAKVGITTGQASAIVANTAKVGITPAQASAIVANTAKVGITTGQASAIVANTAKVGITAGQASAIVDNTAKVGITPAQASAIVANTAKINYPFTTDFISGTERTRDLTIIDNTSGYQYNGSLTSVYLGSNVTIISGESFKDSGLTSINITDSVTIILGYAFFNCASLTEITIPNSVTSIGNYAFAYCSDLTSVNLPENNNYTKIEDETFRGCNSLTSVVIPSNITVIGLKAFRYCNSLGSITIPDSVTKIRFNAFDGCTSATSISIGSGIETIEGGAFKNCHSATRVDCFATSAPTLLSTPNHFEVNTTEIHVPVGATGYTATYGGLTVVADL